MDLYLTWKRALTKVTRKSSDLRCQEACRETVQDIQTEYPSLLFLRFILDSVYYYFVAHILPIISFMNFSLLYFLFLYTFATSNDCLCYFICHYHILLSHHLCRYRISSLLQSLSSTPSSGLLSGSSSFCSSFVISDCHFFYSILFFLLNIPLPHSFSLARSTCYALSFCVYDSMRD